MEYDFIHPKYGKADVDKPFGKITIQSVEPVVEFSCEFANEISSSVKEICGPVLVMDVQSLEAYAIIDRIIFMGPDETGAPVVGISLEEVNDNIVIGQEYVMYLFAEYEYQAEIRRESVEYLSESRNLVIPSDNDFFAILEKPMGTVVLIDNAAFVDDEGMIRAFPKVVVSQSIHMVNSVAIALDPNADKAMLIDFSSKAHLDAAQRYKGALGQPMSDQIALIVFAMIMAHVDGEAETNVEYNIYQAVCTN